MKHNISWKLGPVLIVALGIVLAFSVHAGSSEDALDPLSRAIEWEDAFESWIPSGETAAERSAQRDALLNRAMASSTLPVIVILKNGGVATGAAASAETRSRWAGQRKQVLRGLGLRYGRDRVGVSVKTFEQIGGFAMSADAIDILDLLADPNVLDVVEDVAYPPALLQSTPLIGANGSSDFGSYTGQGQVIAVLDTGVDKAHPLLSGKVVSEACYSTNGSTSSGIRSLCPSGDTASIDAGSGVPCTWESGCSHGTHVAGIAAGNNASYRGVAKDAELIAIQVFTGFPGSYSACGGSPCVLAYTSDIIKGLERVYALRSSFSIASANLSLGGGRYTGTCDRDATKASIDQLRAAGIATIIASGNSAYTDAIGAPACVSTAVSVGASCDAVSGSTCTAVDAVASYSNIAQFISLIAPGSLITSSVPSSGYATWHGTSMATPHVAGAWAVLKEAKPGAGVDEVLGVLRETGKTVYEAGSSFPLPRIQLAEAVAQLSGGGGSEPPPPPPPPAELDAPTLNAATNITGTSFRISWGQVTGATGYRLDLATNSSFSRLLINDADAGDATAVGISRLRRNTTYYVRVRAYNQESVSQNAATRSVKTSRW